jgi:hypothetical protein
MPCPTSDLRFQFWTAVQVVQSSPYCELRDRSVCVLRYSFTDKEYDIFIQVIHLKSNAF